MRPAGRIRSLERRPSNEPRQKCCPLARCLRKHCGFEGHRVHEFISAASQHSMRDARAPPCAGPSRGLVPRSARDLERHHPPWRLIQCTCRDAECSNPLRGLRRSQCSNSRLATAIHSAWARRTCRGASSAIFSTSCSVASASVCLPTFRRNCARRTLASAPG